VSRATVAAGLRALQPAGRDAILGQSQEESPVTVLLRCLNCGFSFTVTYPEPVPVEADSGSLACGHCRSTRWSSHPS